MRADVEGFARTGRFLLAERDVGDAHASFHQWVRDVAAWLDETFPGSGLSAEWGSLGTSILVIGGIADSTDVSRWIHFQRIVERRLAWLAKVAKSRSIAVRPTNRRGPNMPSVFMCHSSKDKFFVRELAKKLGDYGVYVWIDEAEINIGDSLIAKIGDALADVDFVGVVLSSNSVKSEWVQRELSAAMVREFEEKKVVVLPLLLEKVEIPLFLRDKLYADFTTSQNYGETFPKLLRALGVSEEDVQEIPVPEQDTEDAPASAPSEHLLGQFEDVTIVDLDNDRAYRPDPAKLLYQVYFRLSSTPPPEWQEIFEAERRFPRHTMWRRAWVEGNYIVVYCVPDEIEKYHFPDLLQDAENTNKKYREYLKERAQKEIRELTAKDEDKRRLQDLRGRLGFS